MNLAMTGRTDPDLVVSAVGAAVLNLDDVVLLGRRRATDEAGPRLPWGVESLGVVLASDGVRATGWPAREAHVRGVLEECEHVLVRLEGVPEIPERGG